MLVKAVPIESAAITVSQCVVLGPSPLAKGMALPYVLLSPYPFGLVEGQPVAPLDLSELGLALLSQRGHGILLQMLGAPPRICPRPAVAWAFAIFL